MRAHLGGCPITYSFPKRASTTRDAGAEAAAAALKGRPVFEGPDPKVKAFDVAEDGLQDGLEL